MDNLSVKRLLLLFSDWKMLKQSDRERHIGHLWEDLIHIGANPSKVEETVYARFFGYGIGEMRLFFSLERPSMHLHRHVMSYYNTHSESMNASHFVIPSEGEKAYIESIGGKFVSNSNVDLVVSKDQIYTASYMKMYNQDYTALLLFYCTLNIEMDYTTNRILL